MTLMSHQLRVKTHVARDLLQSAALFEDVRRVVLEYVLNGLQYHDPGTSPVVSVTIDTKARRITIADNGRGMRMQGPASFQSFWIMHAENYDRLSGRAGRGRFGTGKSAAFAIADVLTVTSVKDGLRSKCQLTRDAILRCTAPEDQPEIMVLEAEVPTDAPNGTVVEISKVHQKRIDIDEVTRFLERHVAEYPGAKVFVNGVLLEYVEPPACSEHHFYPAEGYEREMLGNVCLVIKVSKVPLEPHQQGVAVMSKGAWLEQTLAGAERKEMSAYIFGRIDVPALDENASPICAMNASRRMELNRANELVQVLLPFIGRSIEAVRRELVAAERRRRLGEEMRRLSAEAAELADIFNEDFAEFRSRLAPPPADTGEHVGPVDRLVVCGGPLDLPPNAVRCRRAKDAPPEEAQDIDGAENGPQKAGGDEPEDEASRKGAADAPRRSQGTSLADPESARPKPRRRQGEFDVAFRDLGEGAPRARYDSETRKILINIEHPQLRQARSEGEAIFRRAYAEAAVQEYALALSHELAAAKEFLSPEEAVREVRLTVDRLIRRLPAICGGAAA